mmetsp:Transcript_14804/g.25946  ORF Transcript_14804/g.25946 Transcript_14804/m.25946 type:complete len:230 (-) Transcript_14804:28-717(-)
MDRTDNSPGHHIPDAWDDSEEEREDSSSNAGGEIVPWGADDGSRHHTMRLSSAASSADRPLRLSTNDGPKAGTTNIEMMCADGKKTSVNVTALQSFYGEDSPLCKSICGTPGLQGSTKFPYESWVLDAFAHMAERGNLPKGFLKTDPERRNRVFVEATDYFLCEKAKALVSVLKANHDKLKDAELVKQKQQNELKKKLQGGYRVSATGVAARNRADRYEKHEKALAKYI